jgi:quinol monooxygenase YgiN
LATLLVHIRVRPGKEASFEGIARELHRASHADEPELIRYEYWRGEEPGSYYTLMAFPSYLGFLAHQTSPHHEGVAGELRDAIEAIRLEWVDPLDGASPLGPTDTEVLPDDATDLERDYSQRYAAKVAEWWLALRPAGGA